jgi:O-antigen/teichoic acid export membrane protein
MQKERSHSFFNSAIFYTLGVAFGLGAQFLLTTVLYGQWLDDVNFGLTQLYYTWFSVFGVIIGLEAANSINTARIHYGEKTLGGYTSSRIGLGAVTFILYAAALLVFQFLLVPAMGFSLPVLISALVQGFFWFCTVLIAQKCRVMKKPVQFVIWSVLAYMLRLVLCAVIVPRMGGDAYMGDIIGSVIGYSAAGVLAVVFLLRDGRTIANRAYWKFCVAITVPIVFHSLANIVLGQADRVMLNSISGTGEMEYTALPTR